MPQPQTSLPTAIALVLMLAGTTLQAADTPEPEPAARPVAADPLVAARGHIASQRWDAAIAALRQTNASGDADWNNLMGYALRKQARPDLDGAQRHYDAALKLNPKHQGALEYAGELALMKGDLATAERHLAALARLCSSPCEALDDLKQAVDAYKAGKR
jgi:tetratricopeptide (TPR) repeat protein